MPGNRKINWLIAIGLLLSVLLTLITGYELTDRVPFGSEPLDGDRQGIPQSTLSIAPVDSATVHNHRAEKPSRDAAGEDRRRKVPENEKVDRADCFVRRRSEPGPGGGRTAVPPTVDGG